MGRDVAAEVDHDLVYVAPSPMLGRIVSLDDRMVRPNEMCVRMAMRRLVATSDMPATPAQAKMDPSRTDLEALLAAECAGHYGRD